MTLNTTLLLVLSLLIAGGLSFFAEEVIKHDYAAAITFFVFTIFFLLGSFVSNFLVELMALKKPNLLHVIPISIEIAVLSSVGFFGMQSDLSSSEGKWIAFSMLFAMGIQNSLVTKISKSIVRTTHLTGLFTDLGIELSQLFFYKKERKRLNASIFLRLSIISFFFIGCISGGFIFTFLELKTLFVSVFFLLIALMYDYIRLQFFVIKRKFFFAQH